MNGNWQIEESKEHKSVYGRNIIDPHKKITICLFYIVNDS